MEQIKDQVVVNPITEEFIRPEKQNYTWCMGCGIGQVVNFTFTAMKELGLDMEKSVMIEGVGCSSRTTYGLFKGDNLNGNHGRNLAFATGLKLANPELNIIAFTGDGDSGAIGGNHFIHAARRNIDMTVIMFNNGIYGMTGGQVAPTTPPGFTTQTTPYGAIEAPFDMCELAKAAGATYVARWSVTHPIQSINAIKKGIQHKGFSYIEIMAPCPTQYGKYALKEGDPVKLFKWYKERCIPLAKVQGGEVDLPSPHFPIGEYVSGIEKPELTEQYRKLIESQGGVY